MKQTLALYLKRLVWDLQHQGMQVAWKWEEEQLRCQLQEIEAELSQSSPECWPGENLETIQTALPQLYYLRLILWMRTPRSTLAAAQAVLGSLHWKGLN